jgi:hypothetical protein
MPCISISNSDHSTLLSRNISDGKQNEDKRHAAGFQKSKINKKFSLFYDQVFIFSIDRA